VSRDELTGPERAELDALDRILAHEHVGEEHLELAALVESVRAGAPRMQPAFRERLDAEVAARVARRRRPARPPGRLLALGGGGLVTAAVALAIVISSGVLNGAAGTPRGTPASARHALSATPPRFNVAGPTGATGGAAGTANLAPVALAPPRSSGRLVRRNSRLVLAAAPPAMQRVANEIVARTEQRGGVVASSSVAVAVGGGGARFSLQIASPRLASLIAALSSLAAVRSLDQATADVTSTYSGIAGRLAAHRAGAASLRAQLAVAPTATAAAAIRRRLAALERTIGAEGRAVASLLGQAHTATLDVTVVPAAAPAHHASAGGGPLSDSFRNALHVLAEMLAVALVVLAIALPLALSALAVAWSAAALRQRARERAIRAA